MGACASIPKSMRGVDGGAPPPEPQKEETTTTTTTTTTEVAQVQTIDKEVTVEGGEKKAEGGDDNAKPEDEKNKDGERRSLGALLETEEVKEPPKTEKINSETETVMEEPLPVSDKAAEEEPAEKAVAPYVAPVARATEDEKETEKK